MTHHIILVRELAPWALLIIHFTLHIAWFTEFEQYSFNAWIYYFTHMFSLTKIIDHLNFILYRKRNQRNYNQMAYNSDIYG